MSFFRLQNKTWCRMMRVLRKKSSIKAVWMYPDKDRAPRDMIPTMRRGFHLSIPIIYLYPPI
jgi:hypothetical protein